MPAEDRATELVGAIIHRCVEQGMSVDIEGFGRFCPTGDGLLDFIPAQRPRVFIAYAAEDLTRVTPICDALSSAGFDPWLDRRRLLAGQNWPDCIERAIDVADFFVPCFSRLSLRKRGQFQRELRQALDAAAAMPIDDTFIMPVRLEPCSVPRRIRSRVQYVDIFPPPEVGISRLIEAMHYELRDRCNRMRCE